MTDDLVPRECTWQTCHEPAIANSPYCAKHADTVTPARLRGMLERAAMLPPKRKAAAEQARAIAAKASDARRDRRRAEKAGRAAGRKAPSGKSRRHRARK